MTWMQTPQYESQRRAAIAVVFLTMSLIILLQITTYTTREQKKTQSWPYNEADFHRIWDVGPLDTVHLTLENTIHYALDMPMDIADSEWNTTLPSGGHLLHFAESEKVYSIAMFHQLRCLNIVREGLVEFRRDGKQKCAERIVERCMDYLRQMVLCRAEVRLESARNPAGPRIAVSDVTHTCRDWTKVFTAAERNFMEYTQRGKDRET